VTERNRTIRNLVIFTVVVLAIGFIGKAIDPGTAPPDESLGILLWILAPTVVALLLRAFAGDGWSDFGIRPRFRGNGFGYGVSLAIYPVLTLVVLALGAAMGMVTFPAFSAASLVVIGKAFVVDAGPQFVKNIFEEAAWRGYLAPRLHSLGLGDYTVHILVGLVWGAWHLPYYLFYLDTELIGAFTTLPLGLFIAQAIVVMVAWAFVYGEVYLITRSIWPAVLMHMVEDAFLNQLFLDGHVRLTPGSDWFISPVNGVVGIVLWLGVGIALNRWRRSRPIVSPSAT
jgi:prepilin-type processing-associated H-X9-DG protein